MRAALPDRRFGGLLALVVVVGVALRVAFVLTTTRHETGLYDATYYNLQARTIVDGLGFFDDPFLMFEDPDARRPAADHPPLTVIVLLPAALIGDPEASEVAMRFTMVLLGAATIALVGLLARALAGDVAGLVAAGIAAVNPNLWINDGLIMSESLAVLLTVGLLLVVYRVLRGRRSWPWIASLGVVTALATLTRAELGLFAPLVVLPTIVATRADRATFRRLVLAGCAFVVVTGPWVAYNLGRFEEPTFVSNGLGLALRSGNCDETYHGDLLAWSAVFPPCTPSRDGAEQSVWDRELQSEALHYIRDNITRAPVVGLARLGRVWHVFRVAQSAELSAGEGRPAWAGWMAAVATWITVPLAVCGAVVLRRRGERTWPLGVSIVTTSLVLLAGIGGMLRYRAPAEPALAVLAAIGLVAIVARRPRALGPPGQPIQLAAPVDDGDARVDRSAEGHEAAKRGEPSGEGRGDAEAPVR